ncbi:MAG: hypothetical protein IJ222_04645 [Bacteroidales bacterium]|nr:hypothetical protein [Bacteroidales bacterium]
MKTFILEWNPVFSPMTEDDYLRAMLCLEWGEFRRGFKEKPTARSGDNFFLLRTGTDTDGLIAKGFFLSDPYKTTKNEEPFRMDLRPTFMVSWENSKGILSIDELRATIEDFPWGESGNCEELQEKDARRLSALWNDYIGRFTEEDFDKGLTVERSGRPKAGIDEAIALASEAHLEQKDLDGNPVILHPLTVGLSGRNEAEKICGFLHDVIEDTEWTAGEIREKGFSEEIIDTLVLLTHEVGIPYMDYVKKIMDSGNQTAIHVKLNDLHHNLERGRKGGYDRLVRKHTEALKYIESHYRKKGDKGLTLRNG